MVGQLMIMKMLLCEHNKRKKLKQEYQDVQLEEGEEQTRVCRVCLKEGSIPLFGDQDSENFVHYLTTIAGIEVDPHDEFPKYLCLSCHLLLEGAISLRKIAQQSDNALRHSTMTVEFENHDDSYIFDDLGYTAKKFEVKERSFHCRKCDLDFKTSEELKDHRTIEHKMKRCECPYCHKTLKADYLKHHLLIHEAPIMCDICGKKCLKGNFASHRLIHTEILPFKCSQCPYRGRLSTSLKLHMRTHTGERPYQCSECPGQFISKSNLNKHMLTHKIERDFKCDQCPRGFYSKRDLDLHFKVDHAGIKEHVCNICGKEFGYRHRMMRHQLKVHKRAKLKSGKLPTYLQIEAQKSTLDESEQK